MRALGLLLLAGCGQLFGLDSPELVDASPDGLSPRVTGSLELHVLQNNAAGQPTVINTFYDPKDVAMTVTQDGVTVPVTVSQDGSFSFDRTAARYTLSLDGFTHYQLTADHLILVDRVSGRLDAVTPSANTTLSMIFTGRPVTGTEFVASSGVFSATGLPATSSTLNWSTATFFGAPGLLDAGHKDQLFYAAYTLSGNELKLSHFAQQEITMANGASTVVNFSVKPEAADSCATVNLPFATEYARLEPLVRAGYTSSAQTLYVRAQAAPEMFTGYVMFLETYGMPQDVTKTINFANPLAGTSLYLATLTLFYHSVGGASLADSSQLFLSMEACPATTFVPAGTAMPGEVTINGIPISEGIVVGVDKTVDFAWSTSSGRADLYSVTLGTVSANGFVPVASYFTTDEHLMLDASMFEPNKTYALNVSVRTGFPNAKMGDFKAYEATRGSSSIYSPSFTIARAN